MTFRSIRLAAVALFVLAGCAQNTETPVSQPVAQQNVTPTSTDQMQATEGTRLTYNFFFGATPGQNVPGDSGDPGDLDDPQTLPYKTLVGDPANPRLETNTGWSFTGNTFNFTTTTGGTTPSVAGTATGTGTATASPVAYPTVTATQEVKPVMTIPVALAFPGGVNEQQAATAGEGGTVSGQTADFMAETRTQLNWIKGEIDKLTPIVQALQQAFNTLMGVPTTQPAIPPAALEN